MKNVKLKITLKIICAIIIVIIGISNVKVTPKETVIDTTNEQKWEIKKFIMIQVNQNYFRNSNYTLLGRKNY